MNKELLKLARDAIKCKLENKDLVVSENIKKKYAEHQACFVSLSINNKLRGCIGTLEAKKELYKDVIDNSIHAAFSDPRFPPLKNSELANIKIEISILSIPRKLDWTDEKDLLKKINKKMGIILKKGFYSSTFLPQVWEQLPDKVDFLENLSIKAGLSKDSWKDSEFWFYKVKSIKEAD